MSEGTSTQSVDNIFGDVGNIIQLNRCSGDVTINIHHNHDQINEPIYTAMLETIARLEAKVDELSLIINSGEKKNEKSAKQRLTIGL